MSDIGSALAMVMSGDVDEELDVLTEAIKERKQQIVANFRLTLSVGDRVRFNDLTRPKYLQGVEATLIEKLQKNIVVLLDEPVGKFGKRIRTSVGLVEVI